MRALKHHEKRLLKKVNFLDWEGRDDFAERHIRQKFVIDDYDDYTKYKKLTAHIRRLADFLKTLPATDEFRTRVVAHLCTALCSMGVLRPSQRSLADLADIGVTRFCRRRLAAMLHTPLKLAGSIQEATKLVQDGHVQVAGEVVTQPAMHVTRNLEDQVTWTPYGTIAATVRSFNRDNDDFTLLGN